MALLFAIDMNKPEENYIDHEVRIRLLEELVGDVKEMRIEMRENFRWTTGLMITLFGGIILHMAKLI